MPRPAADIRASLKKQGGSTLRIELVRHPVGWRRWVRPVGEYSTNVREATASQCAERVPRWLVANT